MRFTEVQAALFQSGIRFVHLAPDQARCDQAQKDFFEAVKLYVSAEEQARGRVPRSEAAFIVCTMQGASVDHAPVMFVEDEEECERRALADAWMIPKADSQGLGPMVVK